VGRQYGKNRTQVFTVDRKITPMPSKKVLVIAYYFPPLGMGGVQRVAKFVKYLPQFGWQPVVLTVKDVEYLSYDPSLMKEIPGDVKIHPTGSIDPLRILFLIKKFIKRKKKRKSGSYTERKSKLLSWFLFPDSKIGWLPWALAKGYFLCKREKIDFVFSTSPPPTAHLIGFFLKLFTGLNWIADFRDLWIGYQFEYHPTFLHRGFKSKLQKMILTHADAVVTDNMQKVDWLKRKCKKIKKLDIIEQGYDAEDFKFPSYKQSDVFKIAYLGTFSPDCNPESFFSALSQLIKENLILKDKISMIHIGLSLGLDLDQLLEKYDLLEVIERKGYLNHREALKFLNQVDLLLLIISSLKQRELIASAKIFEYMAVRRPILAVVPPKGSAAQFVNRLNAGKVVSPDHIPEIKEALFHFYQKFENKTIVSDVKLEDLKSFERKNLTHKLAKILDFIWQKG
jgi:glycosyltransferase involved in cell wall biosynthesis